MNSIKRWGIIFCWALMLTACGGSDSDHQYVSGETAPEVLAAPFIVNLPGVDGNPDDSISVPNGRPIYALLVSGYAVNGNMDELYYYNFAKYVAEQGGYVHFSWWNNLLSPYLGRPLHDLSSYPGTLLDVDNLQDLPAFIPKSPNYGQKSWPKEDFQFQADAKAMVRAIRENNPDAIIVIVGHSMGGNAVARLGSDPDLADIQIDVLAPVDPVGNRSFPVAALARSVDHVESRYNWTRWRATHNEFLGWKQHDCVRGGGVFGNACQNFGTVLNPEYHCTGIGPWRDDPLTEEIVSWGLTPVSLAPLVCPGPYVHQPSQRSFGSNIGYLYHRYQLEAAFPFDYLAGGPMPAYIPGSGSYNIQDYFFDHPAPRVSTQVEDGTNFQKPVVTCADGNDPQVPEIKCTGLDGHGEIVGNRGYDLDSLVFRKHLLPVPYASQVTGTWPLYTEDETPENRRTREDLVRHFVETGDPGGHAPRFPELDMVWEDLIKIVQLLGMPVANAGGPYFGTACDAITFDASASSDPNGEIVSYAWDFENDGTIDITTDSSTVEYAYESAFIGEARLVVTDDDGNTAEDLASVAVLPDTSPPEIESLSPIPPQLWSPNHKMGSVSVEVSVTDSCGATCRIVSVTSSEPENGLGDGDTQPDWQMTGGLTVDLRAERSGTGTGRVYSLTIECVDPSGNVSTSSTEVVVPHNQ